MVGIVADAQRIRRTAEDFSRLLDGAADAATALRELKGVDLYRGNGPWKKVPGEARHELIANLCEWIVERKHDIALTAIDRSHCREKPLHGLPEWMSGALHIALQLQRVQQGTKGNKGRTFLVFDDQRRYDESLTQLLYHPPDWTDDYYDRNPKKARFDQIIDTAFFARSHQVGLVQVADVFAYVFRRYAEITDYGQPESYPGEATRLRAWVEQLATVLIPRSHRWPRRPKSAAARWFCEVAPASLVALN
jgi:hypothetical protein